MRIVLTGKYNYFELSDILESALEDIADIIEKENPELIHEITECHSTPVVSAVVDIGFCKKKEDEPEVLVTENDEVLTFKFVVDSKGVTFEGENIEKPIFTDADRAIVKLHEGLPEVAPVADISGADIVYEGQSNNILITVYSNNVVRYYKNGKLVQETTVQDGKLDDFIEEIKNIFGDKE